MNEGCDEAPRVWTSVRLRSVLNDILLIIEDDNAPTIGSDDTVIDLETDAKLIILAIKRLHNKHNKRYAEKHPEYGDPNIRLITQDEVQDQFRGGYSLEEEVRIVRTLTGEVYKQRIYDSDDYPVEETK